MIVNTGGGQVKPGRFIVEPDTQAPGRVFMSAPTVSSITGEQARALIEALTITIDEVERTRNDGEKGR